MYPQELTNENRYFIDKNEIKEQDPYITYIRSKKRYYFKAFRGCPYNCTYCGNKAIKDANRGAGKYVRRRSVDNVISELKSVLEQFPEINQIHSFDEVFISDSAFLERFVRDYKKKIGLPFSCDAYLNLVDRDKAALMKEAGFYMVNMGVEAFSEHVREKVYGRKKQSNREILEKSRILSEHGIHVIYDFIWDNPIESEGMIEECFWDLIIKLPRPCGFNHYSLSFLPKSELAEKFLEQGIIHESDIVGHSDKGLVQWKVSREYTRSKEAAFWHTIFRLVGFQIQRKNHVFLIPKWIIRIVAKSKNYYLARCVLLFSLILESISEGSTASKIRKKLVSFGRHLGVGRGIKRV
jgi:hypothetical protein